MTNTMSKAQSRFPFTRYKFDSTIRKEVQGLMRPDNWHGLLQVGRDWGWIIGSAAVSWQCWQSQPWPVAAGVYALTVGIIGARQRGLRVSNHQATHNALAQNRNLNFILGTVLSGWFALESFSGYDDTHNSLERGHHPNLGTERDVDHRAVVAQGLYGAGRTPENTKRFLWTIPLKTLSYLKFLVVNRIWNPSEEPQERWLRFLFLGSVVTALTAMGLGPLILLYWVVPLLTTANWIGAVVQLAEHYPLMEAEHTVDLYVSRNRILDPVTGFFLSAHDEGYHLIHHLYPTMPFWNYKKAHAILLQDANYAGLHTQKGVGTLIQQIIG